MIMTVLFAMVGLALILWGLVKLKEIRENPPGDFLPNDEATMLLSLFYNISSGCLDYYRDKDRYPMAVSGARDALLETGYLKGDPDSAKSPLVHLFAIAASEEHGFSLCLFKTKPELVMDILERVEQSGGQLKFHSYTENGNEAIPIPLREPINLSLPLPSRPGAKKK